MQYLVSISLDNDAFASKIAAADEVARILEQLAAQTREACMLQDRTLRDVNGNKVGRADISGLTA